MKILRLILAVFVIVIGTNAPVLAMTSKQQQATYYPDYGMSAGITITLNVNFGGPMPPINFTATVDPNKKDIDLTWDLGPNSTGVVIVRQADTAPTDVNDGQLVYSGSAVSFTDVGAANGDVQYFYAAYGSKGAEVSATSASAYAGGWGMTLIASYLPLILFLILAVVLTIFYQLKDSNILGFLAAIFWIVDGAYCYYLSVTATPPLTTLFQVLGLVGMLGGIAFGIAAGVSFETERSKKQEDKWEAEREPTFEEQIVEARAQRRKTAEQRRADADAARDERSQKVRERDIKKYL